MSRSKLQGFQIQDFTGQLDACASFRFKGVEISFTSIGYSKGSCMNEIVVYDDNGNALHLERGTVEDAINWVINNIK